MPQQYLLYVDLFQIKNIFLKIDAYVILESLFT